MPVEPEPDIPFADDPPVDAEPVVPEPDAEALVLAPAVDAEALIPVLEEVLVVLRVLLQFASRIASGNTKNVFFITSLFYY
jgi:hypothetical protein